jgi:3-hydroxyisobutyrate dehydrogenase-like beta-hydroxyacid dehydrogenase
MAIQSVGVMSPGSMGQAIAQQLQRNGFTVCTALDGRSARSRALAAAAGITDLGCLDAGVFSAPPRDGVHGRLFVSGPDAAAVQALATPELSVRVLNDRIGAASALKMCDAVISKGVTALVLQMLIAAQRYGVAAELEEQLTPPRRRVHDAVIDALPVMPSKAYRWVPEVIEIARMLEAAGMSPKMIEGAADVYTFVAGTALGRETPEGRDRTLDGRGVVAALAGEPW